MEVLAIIISDIKPNYLLRSDNSVLSSMRIGLDSNDNIIELDLSRHLINNNLEALNKLKNLRYLSLSECLITECPDFKLAKLELLDLSDNYLKHLPSIKYLPKLTHLNLSNNEIESSITLDFNNPELRYIDLNHNKISSVIFKKESINHLRLSIMDNNIDKIDSSWNKFLIDDDNSIVVGSDDKVLNICSPNIYKLLNVKESKRNINRWSSNSQSVLKRKSIKELVNHYNKLNGYSHMGVGRPLSWYEMRLVNKEIKELPRDQYTFRE